MSQCPIKACRSEREPGALACRAHWASVPKALRDRVLETKGTPAHEAAVSQALRYLCREQRWGKA